MVIVAYFIMGYFMENLALPVECFLLGNSPALEIQTPGNYPEERKQHSEHGETLKSRIGIISLQMVTRKRRKKWDLNKS